jgi:hypothetical protein
MFLIISTRVSLDNPAPMYGNDKERAGFNNSRKFGGMLQCDTACGKVRRKPHFEAEEENIHTIHALWPKNLRAHIQLHT